MGRLSWNVERFRASNRCRGLCLERGLCSKSDIEAVLAVFDELLWAGDDLGGFGVLEAFAQSDFGRGGDGSDRKACFFAETSCRALLYATEEWAGGETSRAVRKALRDLHRYASDEDFRRRAQFQSWQNLRSHLPGFPTRDAPTSPDDVSRHHLQTLVDECAVRGIPMMHFGRPVGRSGLFSPERLRRRLSALETLQHRVELPLNRFTHGVVYAVRFEPGDVPQLSLKGGAGIAACERVPPERIVGKARVSREVAARDLSQEALERGSRRLLDLLTGGDSLLARLTHRAAG